MDRDVINVRVEAESERYGAADERWLRQVHDLHEDLRAEVRGFELASGASPGSKGVVDTVILALGSAGAFSAAVDCFKAWLARDKSRRITLEWTRDGKPERVVLESSGPLDDDAFRKLSEAIGTGSGGASWPNNTVRS